ncbi:class I SAM-dependent methyltransferase [Patescibacteria group bacterium]|nr:class I SAM-dependent methyltransferase [Patescibacteria group bacterium]
MNQSIIEKQIAWTDYELIDTGNGERLEKFGDNILVRPYPEITWPKSRPQDAWDRADAVFIKTSGDKGCWKTKKELPESWKIHWQDIVATVHLSPFKHTGVFPEQSVHWAWMKNLLIELKKQKPDYQPHILNLFAYTGMASMVCAKTGAKVTHVDSSRSTIGWAKQNQSASSLDEKSIRWILDDVMKFVTREIKRGVKYDGIIMDPPAYGHGKNGEVWNFKSSFPELLDLCEQILVDDPLFVLVNAYAVSISPQTIESMLRDLMKKHDGKIESGELVLQESQSKRLLSTGIFARFGKK